MSTRTVFRGSRGRFAGSSGGRAERVKVGQRSVSGSKVNRGHGIATKAKQVASNRKVQVGVAVGVTGVAGYAAYNKVNPGTTLRKSGLNVPGTVQTFGGRSARTPNHTIVTSPTHVYTTTSIGKGIKKTQHTSIEKITGPKGGRQAIGYIDSKATPLGGYRVSHTYLTRANRGKGLGKQALAAHAAHRPNRTYRASMNRSNMGQAFAKSVGGAGVRSTKSKTAGKGITTQLDKAWTQGVRADRTGLAKKVGNDVKGLKAHTVTGRKVRPGIKRR